MYEQYWHLNRNPFEDTSSPDFFYRSQHHHTALLKLRYLVENRKGAGLLVGGSGYGKSYLASMLRYELPEDYGPFVNLVFPQMSASEILAYLAVELGADESAIGGHDSGLDRTIRQIENQLKHYTSQQRHPVIIIDEAHLIEDWKVFQSLQLLLNYQDQPEISFSLILIGNRSLLPRVARLKPFDERLAVKSLLRPFSREETAEYIAHRMGVAGVNQEVFDSEAINEIFALSEGVPRKINRICDLALLVGYADGLSGLSGSHVAAVSQELTTVVPD